jgi:hypothetical protein
MQPSRRSCGAAGWTPAGAEDLSGRPVPDLQDGILGWLWVHNALALGLWPGYGKYRDLERMLRDRALLREGFLVTRELLGL